jgi:hypothetical protein
LEVFGVDGHDTVFHSWQTVPNGAWSDWATLGWGYTISQIAIAQKSDGRLELFGIDSHGSPFHIWQVTPGGGCSDGWAGLGGGYQIGWHGDPLANVAAVSLDCGEAPKAVAGSQFPLFKMLADLFNCGLAPAGGCIWSKKAVVISRTACASGYC